MRNATPWNQEEVGRVAKWRAAGLTWSQIGARLGRSESAVRKCFQRIRGAPPKQMRKQSGAPRKPPHIVVTTPESLYVRLGSESGRAMLATTRTVIVDEIHALAS